MTGEATAEGTDVGRTAVRDHTRAPESRATADRARDHLDGVRSLRDLIILNIPIPTESSRAFRTSPRLLIFHTGSTLRLHLRSRSPSLRYPRTSASSWCRRRLPRPTTKANGHHRPRPRRIWVACPRTCHRTGFTAACRRWEDGKARHLLPRPRRNSPRSSNAAASSTGEVAEEGGIIAGTDIAEAGSIGGVVGDLVDAVLSKLYATLGSMLAVLTSLCVYCRGNLGTARHV